MKLRIVALTLFLLSFRPCVSYCNLKYLTNDANVVITSDSSGIYCKEYSWSPGRLFPKAEWKGDWIWLNKTKFGQFQRTSTEWINDSNHPRQYTALFRKDFEVEESPKAAILCITADVSFRAYVNGNFVCQGPPNIGSDYADNRPPQHWFFTTHEVEKYLRPGRNTIAVEVYSFGMAISETTSGTGRFICDLNSSPDHVILATDTTWKCYADTCFSTANGQFIFNASTAISDWNQTGFDDSYWPPASIVDTVKSGYLLMSQIPSTIRYPMNATEIFETEQTKQDVVEPNSLTDKLFHDQKLTFHFQRNIPAFYHISLTAHEGDTVRIYPRENSDINRPLVFICKAGKNSFTTPQLNVFNNLMVDVFSTGGLHIDTLYAIYSSYPVSYEGSFSCSDPFYTKLWDIIRWSTQMCMQSYHLDSPNHQEPISDTGDYLVESMSNYYCFGDKWLARQDLVKTAMMMRKNHYRMFHTSYSLLWVQMLSNYSRYTGDTTLVKELVPDVNRLNDLFKTYLDKHFLLSLAPNYMFMDWITIDGYSAHHPPAVIGTGYLTAFYYESLIDAAYLNRLSGNVTRSKSDLQLAGRIKSGINHLLWDRKKMLYRDGIPYLSRVTPYIWLPPDSSIVTYSPHFNALAVLYNIAPKKRQASIMSYVVHQDKIVVQPYFMYFVLSALTHVREFGADGFALINKWKSDIDTVTFTLKEKWPDQNGYAGDLSHAWGGAPLYFMSSRILGITPGESGGGVMNFRPFVTDRLSWAEGSVPLLDGSVISVSWDHSAGGDLVYRINIPLGHKAVVRSPLALMSYALRINGIPYPAKGKPPVLFPGKYQIEYVKKG